MLYERKWATCLTYYVVAQMGQNSISSFKYYFATDYMLETVLFVYCLLFIHTTYLYKLDASRNNILLNSQNNDITISSELMSTQSAENCKGFSETTRQLSDISKLFSFTSLIGLTYCVLHSLENLSGKPDLDFTNVAHLVSISILELTSFYLLIYLWDRVFVLFAKGDRNFFKQPECLLRPLRNTVKYPVHAFSSITPANKLDPAFLTGFIDGEGSFIIKIMRSSTSCTGWKVIPLLQIQLHRRDEELLKQIQTYFSGVGLLRKGGTRDVVAYTVSSIEHLTKTILPHFDKYPLITQKVVDYMLWRKVLMIMAKKEHLTHEGMEKIVALKANLNQGLSDELKAAFPNIISVQRPIVKNKQIWDPQWVAGFTSGEGSFMVKVRKSSAYKTGAQVLLTFQLSQHSRDEQLIRSLIYYLGCGNVYKDRESFHYRVEMFLSPQGIENYEKIIPFFDKYPIVGVKAQDFKDWCKVAGLIKQKKHLAEEGLNQILKIKGGMNTGRL